MNQQSLVEHLLNDYKDQVVYYQDDIVLGHFYGLHREFYDTSFESKYIFESIDGLYHILNAWKLIHSENITNTDIIKSITLPIRFTYGKQWIDHRDIQIAKSNAVLINGI